MTENPDGTTIGFSLSPDSFGRYGWSAFGKDWCVAGSNTTAQAALNAALAEVEAHDRPLR